MGPLRPGAPPARARRPVRAAIAEGHGRSDYALYVDRQLVGVLEAKPDGTTLTEVERVTIGRRLPLRSCDENPLAGFVTR